MVHFTADRVKVIAALKHLKAVFGHDKASTCELTVTSAKATFAVPGALFSVDCISSGAAKAVFPFLSFYKLMKFEGRSDISMTIDDSSVSLGTFSFHAETCFFPDDRILRTIQLPINHTLKDLIQLTKGMYTQEELEFNKIHEKIDAFAGIDKAVLTCYKALKQYGIQQYEIEKFVRERVFGSDDMDP